jgi:HAMP domain-containing protein
MPVKPLLIGAAALLGVLVSWHIISLDSDIAELRSQLARLEALSAARSQLTNTVAETASSGSARLFSSPSENLPPAMGEKHDPRDRLAELESTVDELAQAWNRFAEEEDAKRFRASMRSWGPEQASGAPDTLTAGDRPTAWASLAPDGGPEWLQAEFANPVEVAQVRVLENDNPGAVVKITGLTENGAEVTLWQGEEAKLPAPADQVFNVPAGLRVRSVQVWLDTAKVPGWNEIDAVELIGRDGSRQWAKSTTASSTYASPRDDSFKSGLQFNDDFNANGVLRFSR